MTESTRVTPRSASGCVAFILSLTAFVFAIVTWVQTRPSPPPPLKLADAQQRADTDLHHIAEGSIGSLPSTYSLNPQPVQVLNCRAENGLENGQRTAAVTYAVRGDLSRTSDYFLVMRAWLPEYGWDVRSDTYETPGRYLLNATRDGYLVTARTNTDGGIILANSTPCANPS